MNKDNHLIFESYVKSLNENMPEPVFRMLAKHIKPKRGEEKDSQEFKDQLPDSREEYMDKKEEAETSVDIKRKKNNESRWMSMLKSHFGKEYRREGADPYVDFLDRYSPFWDDEVLRHFSDMYNNSWASNDPESRIDVEHFLKLKNEIRNKAEAENEKRRAGVSEDEQQRLDPKCWKGYHKQGTKLKSGVRVNNCVKNS